eukprot:TRINITY_DN2900_c0_g1_i1.p1 TRINITY_DN2900_c0_g1~~TRINITY_DN2900_c0_g1_i1.p1  ORF type:complete len:174 (+),score=48.41 TRINITY_DN2900_c0_g1_i1:405-926(+)
MKSLLVLSLLFALVVGLNRVERSVIRSEIIERFGEYSEAIDNLFGSQNKDNATLQTRFNEYRAFFTRNDLLKVYDLTGQGGANITTEAELRDLLLSNAPAFAFSRHGIVNHRFEEITEHRAVARPDLIWQYTPYTNNGSGFEEMIPLNWCPFPLEMEFSLADIKVFSFLKFAS